MQKVAVLQSNYIPWKGYFDIINDADIFIFYDDVQYTKNDWRNRNKIKTKNGLLWLTIPTGQAINRLIFQVKPSDSKWQKKHWKTIKQYYSNAPFFRQYEDFFVDFYLQQKWNSLSDLNQYLIKAISQKFLNIDVEFEDSRAYCLRGNKFERLLELLLRVGADTYITGPSAKSYIDEQKLKDSNIDLQYKTYLGYPEYSQFHPPFQHGVSIIDLLFHRGPQSPDYIWGWRQGEAVEL